MKKHLRNPDRKDWQDKMKRTEYENVAIVKTEKKILEQLKPKGDKAIRKYTKEFDGVKLKKLEVSEKEINVADKLIPIELKDAIQQAKSNIEKFHTSQLEEITVRDPMPGIKCWRRSVGSEKIGL